MSLSQTACRLPLCTASAAAKGPSTPEWQLGNLAPNPNVFCVKGSFRSKRYVDRCSRRMLLRRRCGCQTLDLSSCIDAQYKSHEGVIFLLDREGGTGTRVPLKYATGHNHHSWIGGSALCTVVCHCPVPTVRLSVLSHFTVNKVAYILIEYVIAVISG